MSDPVKVGDGRAPEGAPERRSETEAAPSWALALGLVLFALVLLLVMTRLSPPAPKPVDAPAAEFSAGRAMELLRGLIGDNRPHPIGSAANARVRDGVMAELRRLGYAPEVQEGVMCHPFGGCARVQNVVARLEGREPGNSILLMAHYDSVPASPGAGDDMAGVAAVLEIARILKAGAPPRNPVIFLLDDGEEAGLLGAELFASRHPAAAEVEAVVNIEGRGNSGPSRMFEAVGEDARPVALFGANAPRPVTSSVFSAIYERMPNDTDLTVFRKRGVNGLNFAFIGGPHRYHSTGDTLENLSPASLQHHGDNALAAVRGLAEADLSRPAKGDAVFFDVLSAFVVRWPKGMTIVLAAVALVLVLAAVLRARRREAGSRLAGGLAFLLAVIAAGAVAFGLFLVMRGAFPYNWVASPVSEIAAFWLVALGLAGAVAAAFSRRAGAAGLWAGTWLGWAVLGVAVALLAPGIGYLFLVPALVAGIVGLAARTSGALASLVPAAVAAVLWFPILLPLYEGLGVGSLIVIAVLVAALATALAPLYATAGRGLRRAVPILALAAALVCAGLAFASPPFSAEATQPVTVQLHHDADAGQARWIVRNPPPLPAALRQAAEFGEPAPAFPWSGPAMRALIAPAPRLDAPAPQVTVLESAPAPGATPGATPGVDNGGRRVRLRLVSNRRAAQGVLVIPASADLRSARIDGAPLPIEERRPQGASSDWRLLTYRTLPESGAEIELVLGNPQPFEGYVYDVAYGLPPSAQPLLRARPSSAAPLQDGDTTMVSRRIRI